MLRKIGSASLLLAGGLALAQEPAADRQPPSAERQAQAQAKFTAADVDRDGRLDRVEAQALGDRVTRHFDRIDANGDGELEAGEMAKARRQAHHARGKGGERAAYQRGKLHGMDDDGDGHLSRTELGSKAPRLLEQFATIDGNGDGELSAEELRAHRGREKAARQAEAPR